MKWKTHLLFVLSLVILSCSEDSDDTSCEKKETAFVTSVDAPVSGSVNETVAVEVEFQVHNGCGEFGKFIESGSDTNRTIVVEAEYTGCTCTQDLPIRSAIYEFIPDTSGEYLLEFLSGPEEYNSVVIHVD